MARCVAGGGVRVIMMRREAAAAPGQGRLATGWTMSGGGLLGTCFHQPGGRGGGHRPGLQRRASWAYHALSPMMTQEMGHWKWD